MLATKVKIDTSGNNIHHHPKGRDSAVGKLKTREDPCSRLKLQICQIKTIMRSLVECNELANLLKIDANKVGFALLFLVCLTVLSPFFFDLNF
jgi:hypothetical protein